MTTTEHSRNQAHDNTSADSDPARAPDGGDLSAASSAVPLDREKMSALHEARKQMSLILHGPSPDQSFQATVQNAVRELSEIFDKLPEHLNRPGSSNTAIGQLDSEPIDADPQSAWWKQLEQFGITCQNMAARFKSRFLQVQYVGSEILSLSQQINPGSETEVLERNFRLLTTDLHNASKVFDHLAIISVRARASHSPVQIIQEDFPDGVDTILSDVPISLFQTGGKWSSERLLQMFDCSEDGSSFEAVPDERYALVFAEPKIMDSVTEHVQRRGIHGEVSASAEFHNALVHVLVLDAIDIVLDNAGDELCREGMKERLLERGTAGKVSVNTTVEDEMLVISITDNAFGLAQSVIDAWGTGQNLTTKHPGSDYLRTGSGIGLNQASDIILAEGGSTEIVTGDKDQDRTVLSRNKEGEYSVCTRPQNRWPVHGTTVTFRLPVITAGKLSGEFPA